MDQKEEEISEMKEVVMDWLYTFQRMTKAKRADVDKFIFFCKKRKEDQMVSSKRCEKILKKYSEYDWNNLIRDIYLDYIIL